MRAPALLLLLGVAGVARAATGGPDGGGVVWTDSDEPSGPPYGWLDSSTGDAWALGDDATTTLSLPFEFTWYGVARSALTVSSNGVLFFSGASSAASGACPDAGGLDGIAVFWDDLAASTVTTTTYGAWPTRTFVVTWDAAHATYGGRGRFQVQLLEGRSEAVLLYDDVTFGNAAVDGGASAVAGVGDGADGLATTCAGGLSAGTAVWVGLLSTRPASPETAAGDLAFPWYGEADFAYAGRTVAAGDLNGDGIDEALVGDRDRGAGSAYLLFRPYGEGSDLSDADAIFTGRSSGDAFSAALLTTDMDGDGTAEVLIGAPDNDSPGSNAGTTYLWEEPSWGGTLAWSTATGAWTGPAAGQARTGSALAGAEDVDGDGYEDLLVAAPAADAAATDGGSVYLLTGGTLPAGDTALSGADAVFSSATAREGIGTVLTLADLDGDGRAEALIGASGSDRDGGDAGALYVVAGGTWSGAWSVAAAASCILTGADAGERLGTAATVADLDASGALDLVVGAPAADASYTDGGAFYVFYDPGATGCTGDATLADATVYGTGTAANLGASLARGDFDGDGVDDLAVGAPNETTTAASAGAVYTFTTAPSGTGDAGDADRRLAGTESAGALGTALAAAADLTGHTVLAGAPYGNLVGTGDGGVYTWGWAPDFLDEDGDDFVAATVGGNDCDDEEATVFPGGVEVDGDSLDNDCDGWVDGVIAVRTETEGFAWDYARIGASTETRYDFEDYADGDGVEAYGELVFDGVVTAETLVSGAWPVDTLGAEVSPPEVAIDFAEEVDAVGFQLLDPEGSFTLEAENADGIVATYTFESFADDRAGGVFHGFTFIEGVTRVSFTAGSVDGFGFDDLRVVYGHDSDRDGDGFDELDGDCDDADAAVYPGATEDPANGVDDDCDGVIDAGNADLYTDYATWDTATGVDPEQIDFEAITAGEVLTTQYESLGIQFADDPTGRPSVDGTAAHLTTLARAEPDVLTLHFREAQPSVGFYLLDGDGVFTIDAYLDGYPLYTVLLTPTSSDQFVGLSFDFPVNEVRISGPSVTERWGIDDVVFSVLGLDDADGDGVSEAEGDCDDTDATVYEGAEDTWYDGIDSDCAGNDDDDADADGYPLRLDCDDTDETTNPDAEESWYDGVDADCSGGSDYDADRDGHDDVEWGGDDCDDTDDTTNPDAEDTWYDGVDSDCAGNDDFDADGDGSSSGGGGGGGGGEDCDDTDASVSPDAVDEPYDGVDSDCSGEEISDYDADGDGYEAVAWGGEDCDDTEPTAWPGATGERCYDYVDTDCDGLDDFDCDRDGYAWDLYGGEDCDDADDTVNPDAVDAPRDGVDTNCDGAAEFDDDGDGWDGTEDGGRDCDDTDATVHPEVEDACYDGLDADCDGGDDYDCDRDGSVSDLYGGDDCDDFDRATWTGAPDHPYDGADTDCDGTDEWDRDGDGQSVDWYGGTDCDDTDPSIYFGASDTCYDGVDADCGGDSDDDCDGDGFDAERAGGDDCDDTRDGVNPAAVDDPADGVDTNCDGASEEICTDCDGDGHVDVAWGGDDCDDTDAGTYPGAAEVWYDGRDQDCAGGDDYDADGDGASAIAWGGTDCNDADAAMGPAVKLDDCSGRDEDCDGTIDEDCILPTDTATTGDDTGDTDVPDDTAVTDTDTDTDTTRPDPEGWVEAETTPIVAGKRGCGCASAPGAAPVSAAGAVLLGLLLGRRRR